MLSASLLVPLILAATPAPEVQPGSPAATGIRIQGRNYISVPVMVRRNALRLTVNDRAGIYTLTHGCRSIVLVPGFSTAEVDGQRVDLPYPAVFHRGELMVPAQLFVEARRALAAPPPPRPPLQTVILDPGHGGRDSGAVGMGGLREKDVALSVALRLKRLLEERGVRVIMTRSDDTFIPLLGRSSTANSSGADLFLSIHCNAARTRAAAGVETFALSWSVTDSYRAGQAANRHDLGDIIDGVADSVSSTTEKTIFRAHMGEQRRQSLALSRAIQAEMVRLLDDTDRGVKLRNYSVLRETYIPAALAEIGFISHPETERRMRGSGYRQRVAEALAAGICSYGRSEQTRLDRIAGRDGGSGMPPAGAPVASAPAGPTAAADRGAAGARGAYRSLSATTRTRFER